MATSTASRAAWAAAVRVQVHGRGKAPGPVHDDADGQARVVGIDRALQVPVRQGDVLTPDALRAEVGVLGAQGPGLRKRRIREFPEREGGELGVDPTVLIIHGPHASPRGPDPPVTPRLGGSLSPQTPSALGPVPAPREPVLFPGPVGPCQPVHWAAILVV